MHYAFCKSICKGKEKNDESNVIVSIFTFSQARWDSLPLAFSEICSSPFTNDTFQSIDVLAM